MKIRLQLKHKIPGLFLLLMMVSPGQIHSQICRDKLINDKVLIDELNATNNLLAQRKLVEKALTLLENKNQLIPFQGLDTLRIAALSIGSSLATPFQKMLGNYTKVDYFYLAENFSDVELNGVFKKLAGYNLVITGIHVPCNPKISLPVKMGNKVPDAPDRPDCTTDNLEKLLGGISSMTKSVVVFFSNPDAMGEMKDFGHPDGLLIAYQNTTISQQLAAQLLFGGIGAEGRLTVSVGNRYSAGDGLMIRQTIRLKYTVPEEVGLNAEKLNGRIDSIVNNALAQKAFPGCNVLIAKDGKVIFQKAYGFHTYENRIPASLDDIYDLASVTKVTGALPAIMKLNEEGKYLLDIPFSTYWSDWQRRFLHPSNKSDITARELLAHQSGLVPFIPFYKQTLSDNGLLRKLYNVTLSDPYNLEVAPGLYLTSRFKRKAYKAIRKSPLKTRGKYVYSDLSVILTPEVVTKLAGIKYTDYLNQNFYHPLGAFTMTYQPTHQFSYDQIVPTEYDGVFRNRLVHGSVHDESAAIFGGIAGNAGLFASANDLAKLVQMYVQSGTYGGKEYLKKSTIEEFNRVQYPQTNNRRGLGFDKPSIDNQNLDKNKAYPCPGATPRSFGHFGYTGTFFWADPSNGLVYIFLSNRVFPTRENNKISELNTRTAILQEMYDQLREADVKN